MASKNNNEIYYSKKSADLFKYVDRSKEFITELIDENKKLKQRITYLEGVQKNGSFSGENYAEKLQRQYDKLSKKLKVLNDNYGQVESENKVLASRYIEVERQNNNLANLYVASYQLHSTLNLRETIQIIMEIIINLIGAEEFALYLLDDVEGRLQLIAQEGMDKNSKKYIKLGESIIGKAANDAESYYVNNMKHEGSFDDPLAVIPLTIENKVIGVIAIIRLFIQKDGFTSIDHELFTLLAGHTATAIFSAQLYERSERKMSTIKSFLDIIKSN